MLGRRGWKRMLPNHHQHEYLAFHCLLQLWYLLYKRGLFYCITIIHKTKGRVVYFLKKLGPSLLQRRKKPDSGTMEWMEWWKNSGAGWNDPLTGVLPNYCPRALPSLLNCLSKRATKCPKCCAAQKVAKAACYFLSQSPLLQYHFISAEGETTIPWSSGTKLPSRISLLWLTKLVPLTSWLLSLNNFLQHKLYSDSLAFFLAWLSIFFQSIYSLPTCVHSQNGPWGWNC